MVQTAMIARMARFQMRLVQLSALPVPLESSRMQATHSVRTNARLAITVTMMIIASSVLLGAGLQLWVVLVSSRAMRAG